MRSFTDAIIYVADFPTLVGYLNTNAPHILARDEDGELVMPPVVQGFARTPAVVNGDKLLAYMRLTEEQAEQWRGTPGVEVLAEAPYTGKDTADVVYGMLFDDPEATAKYDSVYNREPYEVDDEEGGVTEVTPPQRFGVVA